MSNVTVSAMPSSGCDGFLPSPFWAFCLFGLSLAIGTGLFHYGKRMEQAKTGVLCRLLEADNNELMLAEAASLRRRREYVAALSTVALSLDGILPPPPGANATGVAPPSPRLGLHCVACLTAERNILLENCRHVCLCHKCHNHMWIEKGYVVCPICRELNP